MITTLMSQVKPFLTALQSALGFLAKGSPQSLAGLTKNMRVEPVTLVDKSLAHQPWLIDVLTSVNSIFMGYYLQGVAAIAEVDNVAALKMLEPLKPDRNPIAAISLSKEHMLDPNSYKCGLPTFGLESATTPDENATFDKWKETAHGDALKEDDARSKAIADAVQQREEDRKKATYTINSKSYDNIGQALNLSVGRIFEVSLTRNGQTAKIPVLLRLIVSLIDSDVMTHILGASGRNVKLMDRYHAWRAGQLQFIRDIVLMQDLIDAHKQTLQKDTSGTYKEVSRRGTNNTVAAMATNTVSVAAASNIAVISTRTAKMIESLTKKRFRDGSLITTMFERGYLLLLVVVDDEMERVTFYHRGVPIPTQLSLRELKSANKGAGPDVGEIMKAFMLGQPIRP